MSEVPAGLSPEEYLEEVRRRGPTPEEQAKIVAFLAEQDPEELARWIRADPEAVAAVAEALEPAHLIDGMSDDEWEAFKRNARRTYFDELATELTSYICFVGYSRSGGSIVAALMDAHPQLVVAHELDVFAQDAEGAITPYLAFAERDVLFERTIGESFKFGERRRGQRVREDGTRYYSSYQVEGGSQGVYEDVRAIGTKNAVESSLVAERFGPAPFHALAEQAGLELRFVHVVRNPYDNIATMRRIHGERSVLRYRRRAAGVQVVKDAGFAVLDVHLDDVIEDPGRELSRICAFYGVDADADYLERCAALVADQPSRTGETVEWNDEDLDGIASVIEAYDWLARYAGVRR